MSEDRYSNPEALRFHEKGLPGKISIAPTKPLLTQRDLALAYSPGVAAPCLEIADDPLNALKYTAKGNFVAVISNGTAVLGLGNLGALASKPVMEGKSVLFKRFADIDSVDVEVDTENVDEFVNSVKYLGPSWGGINLEDIKAPDCFLIEDRLKKEMDIPVFHDDQHGTAIVTAAALINACELAGKKLSDIKLVVLGAGSAGIACLELVKSMGVKNALLVDRTGVIYKGRKESMNEWKEKHAADTEDRTLEDAMKGADAFYGLAGKGAVTKEMIADMAKNPIVFAMANPDPEITPAEVAEVRDDAIMATGRSDYPNQVNNVLGFPYIFRGALDVSATTINEEMKIAAANAIAELARKPVPHEVAAAYKRDDLEFGPNYIIPSPFDPRLISTIPVAVAKAAIDSGVAKKKIDDFDEYQRTLAARLNPTANVLSLIYKELRDNPKTVIFAEGEEEITIRAAMQWRENGYGKAILVGREDKISERLKALGLHNRIGDGIEIKKCLYK
jgi:malate dehydrogenase (oxaloacetate-decarboxylating)(NADP+)